MFAIRCGRCFFFNYRAAHQVLPSFPTRRSSDLCTRQSGDLGVGELGGDGPTTQARELNLLIDRKSTRLNSSHVKISYAVFCLKKKKTLKALCSFPISTETVICRTLATWYCWYSN